MFDQGSFKVRSGSFFALSGFLQVCFRPAGALCAGVGGGAPRSFRASRGLLSFYVDSRRVPTASGASRPV